MDRARIVAQKRMSIIGSGISGKLRMRRKGSTSVNAYNLRSAEVGKGGVAEVEEGADTNKKPEIEFDFNYDSEEDEGNTAMPSTTIESSNVEDELNATATLKVAIKSEAGEGKREEGASKVAVVDA
jgi:hypothetical protein